MDKIFLKAVFWMVVFFSGVGVFFIFATRHQDKTEVVVSHPITEPRIPHENPMILIPAGEFIMGSMDGGMDEQPSRKVYLDAYAINQYEVTQTHYNEFITATGHRKPLSRYVTNVDNFDHPNQPAIYIAWEDADTYCKWRGQRLPTEAEWEKAARGSEGGTWPWMLKFRPGVANFIGIEDDGVVTMPVGHYETDKSPYGLYDMAGNAREWVSDWYEQDYYNGGPSKNPQGPEFGETKVMRGGSWNDSHFSGRTTARLKMIPKYRDTAVGFRCVEAIG